MNEEKTIDEILHEYNRATEKFGSFASKHEGYAIILEELDELWDEIKNNSDKEKLRGEAVQLAAMTFRFIVDFCS